MTNDGEIGKLTSDLPESTSTSRRHFCRTAALGAGASLCLLSAPFEIALAGAVSTPEKSRLVVGQLASWRSNPRLSQLRVAFRFLERPDLKQLAVGKYQIDAKAYATVNKSTSQPPALVQFEAHRKYIDVHYMLSGQSIIGFAPIEKLKIVTPYQPAEDAATYSIPDTYVKVKMYPGNFAVFFAGGGHMPNCDLDGTHDLHTVIVKVEHDYGSE